MYASVAVGKMEREEAELVPSWTNRGARFKACTFSLVLTITELSDPLQWVKLIPKFVFFFLSHHRFVQCFSPHSLMIDNPDWILDKLLFSVSTLRECWKNVEKSKDLIYIKSILCIDQIELFIINFFQTWPWVSHNPKALWLLSDNWHVW